MSAQRPPHLQVGYIARAHGLRGEVAVKTFDPASEVLLEVERIHLRGKDGKVSDLRIVESRSTSKEVLLAFDGVPDRTAAEGLVGGTVFVFREDLEPPAEEDDEYFLGDLLNLVAVDEAGNRVGTVEEVWSHSDVPTLVIREGKVEHLLPFIDQFVPAVKLDEGRVVVRLPELEA